MWRLAPIVAIFLLALSNHARAQGIVAQSDHFILISDASIDAHNILDDLEDFQSAVRREFALPHTIDLKPLRLNIVGDAETFTLISPGGNPAGIYRQSAISSDIIVGHSQEAGHWLANGLDPVSLKLVLRHEVVHHILETHYERKLPLWALEGLAEYYATYHVDSEGNAGFGIRLPGQKTISETTNWLPLEKILNSRTRYPDFPNTLRRSLYRPQQLFYAQSMAVAQFIVEQPNGLSKLHRLLDQWNSTGNAEASFQSVFGLDYTELKTRLLKQNRELKTSPDETSFHQESSENLNHSIIQNEPREGELLANQLRLVMTYGQPSDRADGFIASLKAQLSTSESLLSTDHMLLAEALYAWRDQDWTTADLLAAMVYSTTPDSPDGTKLRAKIAYGRLADTQDDAMMWREAQNTTRDALLYQPEDAELHLFRVAVSRPDEGRLSSRALRSLNWLTKRQIYLRRPHASLMMIQALLYEERYDEAQIILDNADRWADTAPDRTLIRNLRGQLRQARMR